jgi:predicted acylesterase/phospholipase RssA
MVTVPFSQDKAVKTAIDPKLKYIAFGGGGAAAFAELGAFNALYDAKRTRDLQSISGTSAGAMMGSLVAFGFRGDEFAPFTRDFDFSSITAFNTGHEKLNAIPNILTKTGIFSGRPLKRWVESAIAVKTGKPDMSFAEMHQWKEEAERSLETGDLQFFEDALRESYTRDEIYMQRYGSILKTNKHGQFPYDFNSAEQLRDNALKLLDFHVIASEVVRGGEKESFKEAVFDYRNPELKDVPIAKAVETSASFPFVFAREKIKGKLYTDGGLVNNVPLEVFDHPDGSPNPEAIAFAIRSQTNKLPKERNAQDEKFEKFIGVLNKLPFIRPWQVDAARKLFNTHMKDELSDPRDSDRTTVLKVKGVDYTDFHISPEEKDRVIWQGYLDANAAFGLDLPTHLAQLKARESSQRFRQ